MMFNAAGRAQLIAMGSLTLILVCLYFARENLRNRKAARASVAKIVGSGD